MPPFFEDDRFRNNDNIARNVISIIENRQKIEYDKDKCGTSTDNMRAQMLKYVRTNRRKAERR